MILGVEATLALFHHETAAARKMLEQIHTLGIRPETVVADKAYGSGEFLVPGIERDGLHLIRFETTVLPWSIANCESSAQAIAQQGRYGWGDRSKDVRSITSGAHPAF